MKYKEYVRYMLENYRELKTTLNLLQYELENYKEMSDREAIEILNYKKADGEYTKTYTLSDKTSAIAIVYDEFAKKIDTRSKASLSAKISALSYELTFLEKAVDGLVVKESCIIKDLFFNQLSHVQIANKNGVSDRWVGALKNKAILKLATVYEKYSTLFGGNSYDEKTKEQ